MFEFIGWEKSSPIELLQIRVNSKIDPETWTKPTESKYMYVGITLWIEHIQIKFI